jgi:integrase
MSNGHPQYTALQSSGYVFRLRLPRQVGQGELRFSLKTHDRLLATRRASDVAMRIREDIQTMEQLTREQIRDLVVSYVRDALESIREYVVHRRGVDLDTYERNLEGLSLYASDLRESLALNELGLVRVDVDSILKKHGLSASAELHRELSHALLSARVDLTEAELRTLRTGRLPRDRPQGPPGKDFGSTTFSEALEGYWKKQAKSWSKRTLVDYQHIREVIEAAFGHRPVAAIKPTHVEAFGRKLTSEGLSPKTVNKYVGFLSSVFGYAERLDLIPKNPASRQSLPEGKKANEQREAFSSGDIGKVFGPEWLSLRTKDPAKYWVPLLAAFTGCRLEELCQLYADDIQEVDGCWCLVVQATRPDQSVKTGEKRTVPLHQAILDRGFLEFVQGQGTGRVFPRLKRVNNRYGHGLGQWFGRFRAKVGVDGSGKVFHSFRHTVATKLKEAGVEDSLVAELLGHVMPGMTFGRYAKASNAQVLLERAVSKLSYPIGER